MRTLLVLMALSGCEQRVGEVHVHQFPTGTHPSATFVDSPVRYHGGDTLFVAEKGDAASGDCQFHSRGPLIYQPNPLDRGPITISGSSGKLELAFKSQTEGYQAPHLPRSAPMFAGGEVLSFENAHFHGSLRTPAPLMVPENLSANDRVIRWTPSDASRIVITLIASKSGGDYGVIECFARDQAGALELPEKLMRRLPPSPRDLQLYVRRDMIGKTASDQGEIILHASYEVKREGTY